MSDDLVKQLRDLGDHASFEPHMHHTAADRIEELEAELEYWRSDSAAGWDKCEEHRIERDALADLLKQRDYRIEELEAADKRLRLEAAHANDTADAAIERTKELEAALPEQIEWVKRLADDLNAAEAREARLEAKLAKALAFLEFLDGNYRHAFGDTARAKIRELHAALKGQDDDN